MKASNIVLRQLPRCRQKYPARIKRRVINVSRTAFNYQAGRQRAVSPAATASAAARQTCLRKGSGSCGHE